MTIDRALKHFDWRLVDKDKNGKPLKLKDYFKPSENDLEALNSIIDFVNTSQQQSLMEHQLFAKLFIEKFIMLAETNHMTAEVCINEIERILSFSVYEMVLILKDKVPMFKFNAIGQDTYPLEDTDVFNLSAISDRNNKIVAQYTNELFECLKTTYSEDDAIAFITSMVHYLTKKYQNINN